MLKYLLLLQIEFTAAIQALYLIHVKAHLCGDSSTGTVLFSDPMKGEGKFLSKLIFQAKINLEYKFLSDSQLLSIGEGPTGEYY